MIQEKNLFYKKYLKPNNQETFQAFSQIQERVQLAIEDSKKKYYEKLSNKLSNDKLNGKCYWAILKRLSNGKKIPCIPPILYEDKFVTDFQVKKGIFNSPFKVRHNFLKNSFFPSVISEWNKLDLEICNSASLEIFKKYLLNFIRLNSNCVFNINNPLGLRLLTRLRIGFSHLKEHKLKYNFQDSLCSCGIAVESTVHFFLHCPNFTTQRQTF